MKLLHNIGESPEDKVEVKANYNTRAEILASDEHLSFDGVYENVYTNRDLLAGRDVLLFVIGDYIGKDNIFDVGMPYEKFCDWNQIIDLLYGGARIGWHTWNHKDLTKMTLEEARYQMTPIFPMEDFAYPGGHFNEDLMRLAEELGYKRAWSATQGNDNPLSLKRTYL